MKYAVAIFLSLSMWADIRINVGGPEYTDTQGRVWQADAHFEGGKPNNSGPFVLQNDIVGTDDDQLFAQQRWDNATAPEMAYRIPVENGTYQVVLYFAEATAGVNRTDYRVFHVDAEGARAFSDINITLETEGERGIVTRFREVTVTDGVLDLEFIHTDKNNPTISAIEIISISLDTTRYTLSWSRPTQHVDGSPLDIPATFYAYEILSFQMDETRSACWQQWEDYVDPTDPTDTTRHDGEMSCWRMSRVGGPENVDPFDQTLIRDKDQSGYVGNKAPDQVHGWKIRYVTVDPNDPTQPSTYDPLTGDIAGRSLWSRTVFKKFPPEVIPPPVPSAPMAVPLTIDTPYTP